MSFHFGFEHFCPVGIYVFIRIQRPVKNFPPSADAGGLRILEKATSSHFRRLPTLAGRFLQAIDKLTRLEAHLSVLWASCKEAYVSATVAKF